MKTNLQNFSGFFQVDSHTRSTRFLWMLWISICLAVLTFGIWAIVVDFFFQTQSQEPFFFEMALVIFFTLVLPALGLIIGSTKIRLKPGIYLRGIRITNSGIEVGTLTVDLDSVGPRNIWEKTNSGNILEGNWTQQKTIKNKAIDILLVLRTGRDAMRRIFFERFVITSREEILYQLIGKNSTETVWNDLVTMSNGSFQLLGDSDGVPTNHLFQPLELAADVISTCRPSNPPSCTLKIVSNSTNLGNVLASGMLGGTIIAGVNYPRDKEPLENISDKNFVKSLRKFVKERGWSLSN